MKVSWKVGMASLAAVGWISMAASISMGGPGSAGVDRASAKQFSGARSSLSHKQLGAMQSAGNIHTRRMSSTSSKGSTLMSLPSSKSSVGQGKFNSSVHNPSNKAKNFQPAGPWSKGGNLGTSVQQPKKSSSSNSPWSNKIKKGSQTDLGKVLQGSDYGKVGGIGGGKGPVKDPGTGGGKGPKLPIDPPVKDPGKTPPLDPGKNPPKDPGTTPPKDPGTTPPKDPPKDPGQNPPMDPGKGPKEPGKGGHGHKHPWRPPYVYGVGYPVYAGSIGYPVYASSPAAPIMANPAPVALQPVTIVNPAGTGTALAFSINSQAQRLEAGSSQQFNLMPGTAIEFDRGRGGEMARYSLSAGTYVFTANERGWELIHSTESEAQQANRF